jgi:O-antigen biosynthesis protein
VIQSGQRSSPAGTVRAATWLSPTTLALIANVDAARESTHVRLSALLGEREVSLVTTATGYECRSGGATEAETLVIGSFPDPDAVAGHRPALQLAANGSSVILSPEQLAEVDTDVRTFARNKLSPLDASSRTRLLEFFASACSGERGGSASPTLRRELFGIREMLRERLEPCVVERDEPLCVQVDSLLSIDDTSFWVRGWLRSADSPPVRLVAMSPEGSRVDLLERVTRHPRPDIDAFYGEPASAPDQRAGFSAHFELDAPSALSEGWTFELLDELGRGVETPAPAVVRDVDTVRDAILDEFCREREPDQELAVGHVWPAFMRMQRRLEESARVEYVRDFGDVPTNAEVSVVVGLFRRLDFLKHQLLHFANDPAMRNAELIYVLDSPWQKDELLEYAADWHALYGVPFRIAILSHNAGFSIMNNLGAGLATGRLLLVLNSDVIPDSPGWLSRLVEFFDRTPNIGAVAPKLLYEDDSLQHAGMFFYRAPGAAEWENLHYYKGLHRSLPAANVTREVPALTAACVLLDRRVYEEIGGFRTIFVRGDFEDSDLCLRLGEAGLACWYLADVELYHLEGQSHLSELRRKPMRYNKWLHTRLWGERIEGLA